MLKKLAGLANSWLSITDDIALFEVGKMGGIAASKTGFHVIKEPFTEGAVWRITSLDTDNSMLFR